MDEGINHIWDAIDSGGIFEYWDENENHERTIDQNWDDENFEEFGFLSWNEADNGDEIIDQYLSDDDIDDDVIDQKWGDVYYEDIGT